ncbi:ariadne RING finger, putative, partial [Entamoeba invadens IP1]
MYSIDSLNFIDYFKQPDEKKLFILEECVKNYREKQISQNVLLFNCEICYEDKPYSDTYVNKCGHRFCKSCIRDSIKEQKTNTRRKVHCPQHGCSQVIEISDINLYDLVDDKQLINEYTERLNKKMFEEQTILCPKCHNSLLSLNSTVNAQCPLCKHEFCKKCLCVCHPGKTCEEWKKQVDDDNENMRKTTEWIKQNTKICPKCKNPIRKNGGCNHMTCSCGHQFCWLCMADYTNTHFKSNTLGANNLLIDFIS